MRLGRAAGDGDVREEWKQLLARAARALRSADDAEAVTLYKPDGCEVRAARELQPFFLYVLVPAGQCFKPFTERPFDPLWLWVPHLCLCLCSTL